MIRCFVTLGVTSVKLYHARPKPQTTVDQHATIIFCTYYTLGYIYKVQNRKQNMPKQLSIFMYFSLTISASTLHQLNYLAIQAKVSDKVIYQGHVHIVLQNLLQGSDGCTQAVEKKHCIQILHLNEMTQL